MITYANLFETFQEIPLLQVVIHFYWSTLANIPSTQILLACTMHMSTWLEYFLWHFVSLMLHAYLLPDYPHPRRWLAFKWGLLFDQTELKLLHVSQSKSMYMCTVTYHYQAFACVVWVIHSFHYVHWALPIWDLSIALLGEFLCVNNSSQKKLSYWEIVYKTQNLFSFQIKKWCDKIFCWWSLRSTLGWAKLGHKT